MGKKYTEEELLDALKKFNVDNGRPPKRDECRKSLGLYGINTYSRRFGSWPKALEAAGLSSTRQPLISDEELIQSFKDFYAAEGRVPTTSDCAKYPGLKGKGTYAARFGSFSKAIVAAGLVPSKSEVKILTKEELLDSFRRFYKEVGRAPKHSDCAATNYLASHATYGKHFGSFTKAIEAAGTPQNDNNLEANKISDYDLLSSLVKFYNATGKVASKQDFINTEYLYNQDTYTNRFGTYAKAVEKAGLISDFDKDILIENLKRFYTEVGRAPKQEDYKTCPYLSSWGTYYRKFGSIKEALSLAEVPIKSTRSVPEQSLETSIKGIYSGEIISNDRKILAGRELDLVLPDLKLAIEFNGLYWHSEAVQKTKTYHIEKTKATNKAGYRLIHIFEHEWANKRDIVISRLSNSLGLSKTIYARKCEIREVSSKDSKSFLELSHIQGNAAGSVKIGLYYEDELVALMTFCKSRFSKKYEWELLRYCNKLGTSVVGGASRLFKRFIKDKSPSSIGSYSDLRWNTGGLYLKLGFTYSHTSQPNYWYFKRLVVESRVKYQKHKLKGKLETFDPSKTEYENMLDNGFNRFFDCGNNVYHWHASNNLAKNSS